jgi:hypothetical protein
MMLLCATSTTGGGLEESIAFDVIEVGLLLLVSTYC